MAAKRGLELVLFAGGNLKLTDRNGDAFEARAYITGNKLYVRADHGQFTADQLTRHEIGHDMIAKNEIDPNTVRERIGAERAERISRMYAEAYAGSDLTAEEIWEEVICDSLADMNIFAGENTEAAAAELLAETGKATERGETVESRGLFVKGKASRDLGVRGEKRNLPKGAAEWSAFNRSFANKTTGIESGKERIVAITTGTHVYFVTADGYMSGFCEKKINVRYRNKIEKARKVYANAIETRRDIDSLAQSYWDVGGQHDWRDFGAGHQGEAGFVGEILDGEQIRHGTGSTEGSYQNIEDEYLTDGQEPGSGAMFFDGERAYKIEEDGSTTEIDLGVENTPPGSTSEPVYPGSKTSREIAVQDRLTKAKREKAANRLAVQQARDAAKRRAMSAEERRATRPDTGNEDTVFAEGDWVGHSTQTEVLALQDVDWVGNYTSIKEAFSACG